VSDEEEKGSKAKPLEPHEITGLREMLKAREFRRTAVALIGKSSTLVPWIGGAILLMQGEYLEALKWWK